MNLTSEISSPGVSADNHRVSPASVAEVVAVIQAAAKSKTGLCAGIDRVQTSQAGRVVPLCLRNMNQVVDYPARDMTITVQSGMTVGRLTEILKTENQQLPIDVADPEVTAGAMVAGDFSGPRRYGYSTLRDYLIGMEAVDGSGRIFHAGGRVVKNVAGYDLCRLMIGSRGALGVLTQLTFKLKPIPPAERLLVAAFKDLNELENGLERLNRSAACPIILDVCSRTILTSMLPAADALPETSRSGVYLIFSVSGTEIACNWQITTLKDELLGKASWIEELYSGNGDRQRQITADFCQTVAAAQRATGNTAWLARLSTLPSRTVSSILALAGQHCDYFGRAGNGVLYIRPAAAGSGERPALEDPCIQILNGLTSDGTGTLNVLKSTKTRTTRKSAHVVELSRSLRALFDPGQVFHDL
jgi:FAD/FMN-containing dehydrogenase